MNAPHRTPADPATAALREVLFRPMGARGVFARTQLFEGVVEGLSTLVTQERPGDAEVFRFPPVMSRSALERAGYVRNFPNLLGCVCGLPEAAEPAPDAPADAELVLTPASCYPVYPLAAAEGAVPARGLNFDVACDCFRREPSDDLDRLQSFRMREFVHVGAREQVAEFRGAWMTRAAELAGRLGLPHRLEPAHDPFFGRGARFLAASQLNSGLKYELLIPILPGRGPTACMSFNLHETHFSEIWDLRGETGELAFTGCVAFGIDRLALALFTAHGVQPQAWPEPVRRALSL